MVNRRNQDLKNLLVFLALLVLINIISSFFFSRIDFTKEKRYTLSPVSKQLISNLDNDLQVTVYLEGDFPAGFKRLRNSTNDMLSDLKAYSNGKLHFDFINPSQGDAKSQESSYSQLLEKGIEPTNLSVKTEEGLSQKTIFPAALITYKGQQIAVKLLQNRSGASPEEVLNNSIQNLEYAFVSAIKKVSSGGKPRVGFTEGHGELNDLQLNDAMKSLADGYEVGRVDLSVIPLTGLDKLKLLIIPKPATAFTEAEKFKIDYFVMRGGRVFWAIDQVNAELDSLRGAGEQLAFPKKLNLDDILFKYGARINYNLIADLNCVQVPVNVGNVAGQEQIQLLPWLFYPIFIPTSAHPLVKNLDGIRSEFSNTIDVIDVKDIRKQVILSTSPFNRIVEAPALLSLQMVEQEPDPKAFESTAKPVAVLLEGSFASNFKNRPVPAGVEGSLDIPEKGKPTKMIVMADGDILKNQISSTDGSPFPLGYDRYTQQQYGNKNFLMNVADYLTDDSGIIELRNKEVKIRLLDRARIREEKTFWQTLNLGLPLILLVVSGIFQHYYRRRKYAR
ncbi:gliding motility-associated ABC transporter substrate-binding protein GldG [Daejeonella oryzae]|uniref:gliding motility-associated ABC transporter substrate-binding protein GldG n=1 Tax=Daejeonella oryzae TaxID=1122943 RepID=UPI00047AA6E9|nr:gliding motility-associated ABC transporter substrate-binding protein GldG [Daejeonella oryzae]